MHYGSQTPAGQWPFDESQPTGPGLPIWPAIEQHQPAVAAPGIPQYVQQQYPVQAPVPAPAHHSQPQPYFTGGGAPAALPLHPMSQSAGSAAQVAELGFAYPVAGMPATFPGLLTEQLPEVGEASSLAPRSKNGRGWRIRWINIVALIALTGLSGATAAFAMNYDAIMNPDSAKSAGKSPASAKNNAKPDANPASPALEGSGQAGASAVDPAKPAPAAQAVLTQSEVDAALKKAQALAVQGKLGKASAVLHPLLDRPGSSKFPELTKSHETIDGRITRANAAVKAARIKIANGNVAGAKTQLAQAERLHPGRSDVKALMSRANKLGAGDATGGGAAGTDKPAGVKPTDTKKPVLNTKPAPGTTGGSTTKPPPAVTNPAPLPSAPSVRPPGGGAAAPPAAGLPSAANGGPAVTPTDGHNHTH